MTSCPINFDRPLLRARRMRAAALGRSTFLLDRVAEDVADRLAAVLRRFERVVDLGTPTDSVRRVLAASGKVGTVIAADALAGACPVAEGEPAVAADEEALRSATPARSRGVGAGAAIRQRPAGRTGANPPRLEA